MHWNSCKLWLIAKNGYGMHLTSLGSDSTSGNHTELGTECRFRIDSSRSIEEVPPKPPNSDIPSIHSTAKEP
ncbi:hypothetical protein FPOAC1_008469 [Fusarium poae]|uniref:hypothetical protein n=1 Tax=Fusarium poae TaxID=36050 RepID=UPI001CEA7BA5|nr:hypothetical protein FPOAC1_008469 [Fusarium poae]KAG8669081.1 hypothetical protein FPOAC1_008469 [Fusarium poae]